MNFEPFEPVEISKQSNNILIAHDTRSLNEFWEKVDSELGDGVSTSIGCYIFAIRAGKGILPWYVGLAEKQSFRKECFTHHKITHYNNAIADRKGTPLLFLISKQTPRGKLVRPTGSKHRDIKYLETMLIGTCLHRNSRLFNVKDTKLLREMVVPGLLNSQKGKASGTVRKFKTLIGA